MRLNKVRVDYPWQVAVYTDSGYHLEFNGWCAWMVKVLH